MAFPYTFPFFFDPSPTVGPCRVAFIEKFTQQEQQDRIWYTHSPPASPFAAYAWLEPVPMNALAHKALSLVKHGNHAWLCTANKVYRASTTDDELDISSRLLEVDMRQYPDIRKGSLKLVLDNTGGWYNNFDCLGQEVTIGFGYHTPEGNEYSLASAFWITKFKLVSPPWYPLRMIFPSGILGTLKIETEDVWRFLHRYRTRRHLEWTAGDKSVKELLQLFFARIGLSFQVISESDAVIHFRPAFEVRVGTSYRTIIKNLMKMIPDQLIFREATVYLRNPTTSEEVDWTYHSMLGNALLLYRGQYGKSAWDPNRAEVWGDTFMKMEAEWPQVEKVRDRLSRVTTPTYPDTTRAGERADAELRRAEILTGADTWMNAPVNCGLEPWDKVQITDTVGGVSNILRRVIRIKTYWNRQHWGYYQIMTLGAD